MIPPECGPGNAFVVCMLERSVFVCSRGNGSGTRVPVRRVHGMYVWECPGCVVRAAGGRVGPG